MTRPDLSPDQLERLIRLLEQRLQVIGDDQLRENDPESQLAQLREVSESIDAFREENRDDIPFRLNHFLENCSFDKALAWAKEARYGE